MTDVELASLLSELRQTANALNSEMGAVNSIISQVEAQLVGMNLGLECWLDHDLDLIQVGHAMEPSSDEPDAPFEVIRIETQLGFSKVGGNWCLSVRKASYTENRQFESAQDGVKLQDTSRETRIRGLQLLPTLLSKLKAKAEQDRRTIQDAQKLIGG